MFRTVFVSRGSHLGVPVIRILLIQIPRVQLDKRVTNANASVKKGNSIQTDALKYASLEDVFILCQFVNNNFANFRCWL